MRLIGTLVTIGLLALAGWWAWNHFPQIGQFVQTHVSSQDLVTLEVRYTPEQILEAHRDALLPDEEHAFRKPQLLFYPYLLLEVKYTAGGKVTREGVMLWGLDDGELVIDASSWEKTHGFEDCINAKAHKNDYRIITALAANGNRMHRDDLVRALCVQPDVLERWVELCVKRKLIVQEGSRLRLHFDKPRLNVAPETHISNMLVTKHVKNAVKLERRYQPSQIEKASCSAFGNDFAIRNSREVFLPVYCIEVENPDGSVATSYWNALTGSRMPQSYF